MSRWVYTAGLAAVITGSVIQLSAQHATSTYRAPKTPWGDPDLQGNYGLKNILSAARAEERK